MQEFLKEYSATASLLTELKLLLLYLMILSAWLLWFKLWLPRPTALLLLPRLLPFKLNGLRLTEEGAE